MVKTQSASGVDELLRAAEILDNWDREREHGYAAIAPRHGHQDSVDPSGEPGSSGLSLSSSSSSSSAAPSSALARACGGSLAHNSGVVAAVIVKSNGRRRRHSGSSSSGRRISSSSSSPDQKVRGSGKESVQNGFVRSAHNELEKSRRASMRGCLESLRHLLPNEHLERTSTGKNTTLSVLRSARSFIKALHECLEQKADTRAQLMSEQTKKLHRLSQLTGMAHPVATVNSGNIDTMKLETLAVAAATAAVNETSLPRPISPFENSKATTTTTLSTLGATSSFDGSPPSISVIKSGSSVMSPLVVNNQLGAKSGDKLRTTSESVTVNVQSQLKRIEIKRKTGGTTKLPEEGKNEVADFHVVTGDTLPGRVVFVSPMTESDDTPMATVSAVPRIVATTIRR